MDWNNIQNFSSNIVFGILLFSMTVYWISLFFLEGTNSFSRVGRLSSVIANILLFLFFVQDG